MLHTSYIIAVFIGLALLLVWGYGKDKHTVGLWMYLGGVLIAFAGYRFRYPFVQIDPLLTGHIFVCLFLFAFKDILPSISKETFEIKVIIGLSVLFCVDTYLAQMLNKVFLGNAFQVAAMPLLTIVLASTFVRSREDVERGVLFASLSFAVFFVFHYAILKMGLAYERGDAGAQLTTVVENWGMDYIVFGNWYGALAAVMLPAPFVLMLSEKKFPILAAGVVIVGLCPLVMGGTRGGLLSVAVCLPLGTLAMIRYSRDKKMLRVRLTVLMLCAIAMLTLGGLSLSDVAADKIKDFIVNKLSSRNIEYRLNLIYDAMDSLRWKFFGIGIGRLWELENADEASYFLFIMNGTGVIGIGCVLLLFLVILAFSLRNIVKGDEWSRKYGLIGAMVVLSIFIAGNSSEQILSEPQTSVPIWTLIICCVKARHFNLGRVRKWNRNARLDSRYRRYAKQARRTAKPAEEPFGAGPALRS